MRFPVSVRRLLLTSFLLFTTTLLINIPRLAAQPDLGELIDLPVRIGADAHPATAAVRFNELNTLVRDGKIDRKSARTRLQQLLDELRVEYYRRGGVDYRKQSWVFPLAGYNAQAIGGGRNMGYVASGYDYFRGNRHGGHPAFDIFIHDRNRDRLDDRNGKPVRVLSLTGGIVVGLEREWQQGSELRGGKYIWIFDPANNLLVYYAHNSDLFVELGQMVKPGDPLAIVGRSGYNAAKQRSPSHLHLSVLHIRDGAPAPLNVYRELSNAGTVAE